MNRIRVAQACIIAAVTLAGLYFSFRILNPTPPSTLTLLTGPPGSAYEQFGAQYRELLAENNVEVVLKATSGAVENLELLSQGEADLGFLTMGTPDAAQASGLRSLGALFLEPLWIFTRDEEMRQGRISNLAGSRIAIGPEKSRSNAASRYLLALNGVEEDSLELLALAPDVAADQLLAGDIDSLFMVANVVSPVITRLMSAPEVGLVNFQRADAYAALFPELTPLVVPAGAGSLSLDLPPRDTRVLAFTSILAVREDLHPITQSLFLEAAARIHSKPDLFHSSDEYPQPKDQIILLSDSARTYYADGRPLLLRLLPYPMAVLVMQLFAAAIPLLGILYPMVRLMPSVFHWAIRRQFYRVYNELRQIDRGLETAGPDQLQAHRVRLEALEHRVTSLRVPITYATMVYALKAHIASVLQRVRDSLAQQGIGP